MTTLSDFRRLYELDRADIMSARRQYRILRIMGAGGQSHGMSRQEARQFLYDFYAHLDWYLYLSSK